MFRAPHTVPATSLQPPGRPPPPAGPLAASPRPSPEPGPPPSAARRPARAIGVSGAWEAAVAAATAAAIFFLPSPWRAAGSAERGAAAGSMLPGRAAGDGGRRRGSAGLSARPEALVPERWPECAGASRLALAARRLGPGSSSVAPAGPVALLSWLHLSCIFMIVCHTRCPWTVSKA
nr:atherin-like [Meriones unguiculatus]